MTAEPEGRSPGSWSDLRSGKGRTGGSDGERLSEAVAWARHIGCELDGSADTIPPKALEGRSLAEKAESLASLLSQVGGELTSAREAANGLCRILSMPTFTAASAARTAHYVAELLRMQQSRIGGE